MSVKQTVLGLLAAGPAHGYRLCARMNTSFGAMRAIGSSRVYAVLAELEREGLATGRTERDARSGTRRLFELTGRGHAAHRAWLARPMECRGLLRRPLLVKIAVARSLGERVPARTLRAERNARERLLRSLREARGRTAIERLLDERAARHLEVELWLLDEVSVAQSPPPVRVPPSREHGAPADADGPTLRPRARGSR